VITCLVFGVVVLVACSTQPAASGAGEECFQATDCQSGLICVPQPSGARLCSNDLSKVAGRPPPEAGAADTGGDGPREGAPADGPKQDTSMPDTSVPDTSAPDTSVADAAAG
jgi:hypothetical protein